MLLRNSEKYKWFSPRLGSITIHVKRINENKKIWSKELDRGDKKKKCKLLITNKIERNYVICYEL